MDAETRPSGACHTEDFVEEQNTPLGNSCCNASTKCNTVASYCNQRSAPRCSGTEIYARDESAWFRSTSDLVDATTPSDLKPLGKQNSADGNHRPSSVSLSSRTADDVITWGATTVAARSRDRHLCSRDGLAPPTSASGLGSPLPHLRRDCVHARTSSTWQHCSDKCMLPAAWHGTGLLGPMRSACAREGFVEAPVASQREPRPCRGQEHREVTCGGGDYKADGQSAAAASALARIGLTRLLRRLRLIGPLQPRLRSDHALCAMHGVAARSPCVREATDEA